MRELTGHKVNTINECIVVEVLDEPNASGANHEYRIRGLKGPLDHHPIPTIDIRFQNGATRENGANGITHESLLAILIDRLEGFQRGPFVCEANRIALNHLQDAQKTLLMRTKERLARGVEGTHQI